MNRVTYGKALGKQLFVGFIILVVVITSSHILIPLDSPVKIGLFVMIGVLVLLAGIAAVNRLASITCPHCKSELFEIIEAGKWQKLKLRFCPCCGNEIEM